MDRNKQSRTAMLVIALCLCSPALLARAPAPFPAASLKLNSVRIQGTWRVVKVSANGKHPAHEVRDMQVWVISKDRITVSYSGGEKDEFLYKLGSSTTPRTIDLTPAPGSSTRSTFLGICELEGKRLKVCRARWQRPASMAADEVERGEALFVLERARR
jgi:uncharacterized protein (TIGR03067 family)